MSNQLSASFNSVKVSPQGIEINKRFSGVVGQSSPLCLETKEPLQEYLNVMFPIHHMASQIKTCEMDKFKQLN